MFRSWLALLTPGGTTETTHRPGVSLHHTAMARTVGGVKDALCAEVRGADGRRQRYVYVELEQGANADRITEALTQSSPFAATTAQAQEVHAAIRQLLAALAGASVADQVRIQYGGSVKPDNAAELMSQPDVDGALVGGASLKAPDFSQIVKGALR